jgi:hypothetical protein
LCLFGRLQARRTPRGVPSPIGRPFSEDPIRLAEPFVGARFGHGKAAWSSRNASRIYHRRNRDHGILLRSMVAREELRVFEELISRIDSLTEAQMNTLGARRGWPAKDCWHIWPTGSGLRLNSFANSKLEGGRRKSVLEPKSSVPTERSFPRIGPRHDIFFARN